MIKKITLCILIVIFIDLVVAFSFFGVRSFPRLVIWNIIEPDKATDLYWPPEDAPRYFYFEPDNPKLELFRFQISDLIQNKDNELDKILTIGNYVMDLGRTKGHYSKTLSWGSPHEILEQLKQGKSGTCFHYSILFSTFLASIKTKSRLWALEGDDGLSRFGHTVAEVYIKDLNKWVMVDVINKLYFKENDLPLSVLELREKLLNGRLTNITLQAEAEGVKPERLFSLYARLLKCVFLRTGNDFLYKYNARIRYGRLYKLQRFFDKFPSDIRRGLSYLLGRHDYLIHYVDRFDKSLRFQIIVAKICFYFLPLSLLLITFCFIRNCL